MAKQGKRRPVKRLRDDVSLLLRSAESLGRLVGSLQRQLHEATKRLSGDRARRVRSADDHASTPAAKSAAARKTAGRNRSGANRRSRKATRHT